VPRRGATHVVTGVCRAPREAVVTTGLRLWFVFFASFEIDPRRDRRGAFVVPLEPNECALTHPKGVRTHPAI
jgi:hypothetical protein